MHRSSALADVILTTGTRLRCSRLKQQWRQHVAQVLSDVGLRGANRRDTDFRDSDGLEDGPLDSVGRFRGAGTILLERAAQGVEGLSQRLELPFLLLDPRGLRLRGRDRHRRVAVEIHVFTVRANSRTLWHIVDHEPDVLRPRRSLCSIAP
jgi:hypothetical protein